MVFAGSTGGGEQRGDVIGSVGFVCLACLCVAAGIALAANATGASTRRVIFGIDDTINPNDASPASLARLPRIGPARAREIISYRSRFSERADPKPVFSRAEDLRRVSGIGPATVDAIRPWLSFDSRSAGERDVAGPRP